MRTLTSTVAALLVIILGAASCDSGDPEPEPTPIIASPSETASETPSPSSSPSREPALGPKETVRTWVELINSSRASGDYDEFRKLSKGCAFCEQVADRIEGIYAAGGHAEGGDWKIKGLRPTENAQPPEYREFYLDIVSEPSKFYTTGDGSPEVYGSVAQSYIVLVKQGRSDWVVSDVIQTA